jgi:hypothetical protein
MSRKAVDMDHVPFVEVPLGELGGRAPILKTPRGLKWKVLETDYFSYRAA